MKNQTIAVPRFLHLSKGRNNRNQHKRFLYRTHFSRMKIIIYTGLTCIMSLILHPSSSSTSIIEDVSSDMLDSSDGIFTSNNDLQKLLSTEEAIMFELQEYVRNEEKRLDKLKG